MRTFKAYRHLVFITIRISKAYKHLPLVTMYPVGTFIQSKFIYMQFLRGFMPDIHLFMLSIKICSHCLYACKQSIHSFIHTLIHSINFCIHIHISDIHSFMLSIKTCGQRLYACQQSLNQYNHTVCTTMQLYNQCTNKPSDLPKILKARFEKYSISTVHRNCLPVQTASCVFRNIQT